MKVAVPILVILALGGCSRDDGDTGCRSPPNSPTSPTPPRPTSGTTSVWLWAMVVDPTGVCIPGAALATSGQRAGERFVQRTPCDAWAYDGGVMLTGLLTTATMTIRSDAAGYEPQEIVIQPSPVRRWLCCSHRQKTLTILRPSDLWCCGCPNDKAWVLIRQRVRKWFSFDAPYYGWAS